MEPSNWLLLEIKKIKLLFIRNTTPKLTFYKDNCLYAAQSKNIINKKRKKPLYTKALKRV